MYNFDHLAQLPGEKREQDWVRERLETLSVRECVILTAALRNPPGNAVDAINRLQSLDWYTVQPGMGSYAELGEFYLRSDAHMPENALPFIDLTQIGEEYGDRHPGQFVGCCYVQYPENVPQPIYKGQGTLLPNDDDWSVKLKLASPAVPEGIWLRPAGTFPENLLLPRRGGPGAPGAEGPVLG